MKYYFIFFIILSGCNYASVEKEHYANGQIKLTVPLKNGQRHGTLKKYYETGELQYLSNWKNDIKQGEAIQYFKNGQSHFEEYYEDGLSHGLIKEYDSLGNLKKEMKFAHGNITKEISFFDNGLTEGIIYMNGDSIMARYYHKNGQLDEISLRINNQLHFARKYNEQGEVLSSNLPVLAKFDINNDQSRLLIELVYTDCLDCTYYVILAILNEDNSVEKEIVRKASDERIITIELDPSISNYENLTGLFYEYDKAERIVGYSPFELPDFDSMKE